MKVRELMTAPATTVAADTRVGEIARLLISLGVSGLPVTDADGSLVGLVTDRDVVTKHAHPHFPTYLGILGFVLPFDSRGSEAEMQRILGVTAADLMTRQPYTIAPEADVEDAADLMVEKDADAIPVVDAGRVVGMITRLEILKLVGREESDADQGGAG